MIRLNSNNENIEICDRSFFLSCLEDTDGLRLSRNWKMAKFSAIFVALVVILVDVGDGAPILKAQDVEGKFCFIYFY